MNMIKKTNFTQEQVLAIFDLWRKKAYKKYKQRKFSKALKNVEIAARWMYNFNILYADELLDRIIKDVSIGIFGEQSISSNDKDTICFLDSIGSVKCLDLQYLRGLMALNKKIVYILHTNFTQCDDIISELTEYGNAEIHLIKGSSAEECIRAINNIVLRSSASKVILHSLPQDAISLASIASIKNLTKYNINLQDHTFWLGSSIIDYNLEFRSYGERVSLERRNLKRYQLINIPYYPITTAFSQFAGLPNIPDDAIVVLTGSAQYKMLGKNDIFFKLMDAVLSCSAKAHILIATIGGDALLSQKIKTMKCGDRVHLIGNRNDINHVFSRSDIFLSTYPFIGGLMTQYAAIYGLPILAYADKGEANIVEDLVNHHKSSAKTHWNLKSFVEYAKSILEDAEFRKSEGLNNKDAIISEREFNENLKLVLESNTSSINWLHEVVPNYSGMTRFYLDNENHRIHGGLKSMISNLKWRVFFYFPKNTITIIQCVWYWLKGR